MKCRIALLIASFFAFPCNAQVSLGTSTSVNNPQRSGEASTGLYTPSSGSVAVTSSGTEIMRVNGTGIGIGTVSPSFLLDVYKANTPGAIFGASYPIYAWGNFPNVGFNVYYNGTNFLYGRGSSSAYGGTIQLNPNNGQFQFLQSNSAGNAGATATMRTNLVITPSGSLGLGTVTPMAFAHIEGGSAGGYPAFINSVDRLLLENSGDAYFHILVPAANTAGIEIDSPTVRANGFMVFSNATNTWFIGNNQQPTLNIASNGRLGINIGTTTPDALISVSGQSAETIHLMRNTTAGATGNNLTVGAGGAAAGGNNLNGGNLILASGISTGTGTSQIQFQTYPSGSSGTADNSPITVQTISGAGVGVGTTTPQSLIHAFGGELQTGSSGTTCTTEKNGAIRFSSSSLYYCTGTVWTTIGSGTITSIATNNGITGGTIVGSGTVGLAPIGTAQLLANPTGSSGVPVGTSLSAALDAGACSTQGSIIYRNGSTWSCLAPGTSGQVLQTNGVGANPTWVNTGGASGAINNITTQTFTSGGTYTPNAGLVYAYVRVVGGGGGGGGASSSSGGSACGSGGGAGAYAEAYLTSATIGTSQSVTVGSGGSGGSAAADGSNGSQTSLGSLLSANGGFHGVGGSNTSGYAIQGGAGSNTTSGASFYTPGGSGGNCTVQAYNSNFNSGGSGGASAFGGGGVGGYYSNGSVGQAYGSGGGGAGAGSSGQNTSGAAGASGVVVITEYNSQ